MWTVLAAIVATTENSIDVVSLATGTKSIGRKQMCNQGYLLNDLHAEVLAH